VKLARFRALARLQKVHLFSQKVLYKIKFFRHVCCYARMGAFHVRPAAIITGLALLLR
jgi:hypothetical protein